MPSPHVPHRSTQSLPLCKRVGVLWRCEASVMWFQGGSRLSQLCPRQQWKSRKWQQAPEGWVRLKTTMGFMVSPTEWAWFPACGGVFLLCPTHPFFIRKASQRIISLFFRSRSGVQIPISLVCQSLCCRQQYHSFSLSLLPCPASWICVWIKGLSHCAQL